MADITTIAESDLITDSRAVINTNFANLNSDKIETSYLDTDTALTADSNVKIPSQKAIKAYVDSGGNPNASETAKGIVEEATDAEVTAGTATGGTGAKLFVTPTKLATRLTGLVGGNSNFTVGALSNSTIKSYFNIQLPFILFAGAILNDITTTFSNWVRGSEDMGVAAGGSMLNITGTGSDYIYLDFWNSLMAYNSSNKLVLDFWAKLPASGTGDIFMGFSDPGAGYFTYNQTARRVGFGQRGSTGVIYSTISKSTVGTSTTDVSAGITVTNWNNYRIELDVSSQARFYINGVLVDTLSGTNLENGNYPIDINFSRSDTSLFQITAPNLSIKMI